MLDSPEALHLDPSVFFQTIQACVALHEVAQKVGAATHRHPSWPRQPQAEACAGRPFRCLSWPLWACVLVHILKCVCVHGSHARSQPMPITAECCSVPLQLHFTCIYSMCSVSPVQPAAPPCAAGRVCFVLCGLIKPYVRAKLYVHHETPVPTQAHAHATAHKPAHAHLAIAYAAACGFV